MKITPPILRLLTLFLLGFLPPFSVARAADKPSQPPNVLFIAIDDLNDWVGCLGGHPQAQTPHMDRLARRGTLFLNAHCQAPLCNPSRTSILTGLRPSTTGIYGLAPWFRSVERLKPIVTLPQYLRAHGYQTLIGGKIYHNGYPPKAQQPQEADVWGPPATVGARPKTKLVTTPNGNHPLVDWGTFPHRDQDKGDWKVASWAVDQIRARPKQPFFLAVGFFLPHVPCYATEKWFDLYPEDKLVLPPVLDRDRDDVPEFSWFLHWILPEPRLSWLKTHHQWRPLVRAYLACVSFVDSQVGRVLDALEASGQADNTLIVLWSDHGWHLGEKAISGKNSLWERSTRVPLIVAGPGVTQGAKCAQPVELLDLYPTLVDLCGLPAKESLEGHSLVPQLKDAQAKRPWPAITTHNQGNHSVRTEHFRYIRYADGSEEFYDHRHDPNEWTNLISNSDYAGLVAEHRRWLPKVDLPPAPGSAYRVLTYNKETGVAVWEGKVIDPRDKQP
jgi:choline-sulfatase